MSGVAKGTNFSVVKLLDCINKQNKNKEQDL
jgi:hypothetical protein